MGRVFHSASRNGMPENVVAVVVVLLFLYALQFVLALLNMYTDCCSVAVNTVLKDFCFDGTHFVAYVLKSQLILRGLIQETLITKYNRFLTRFPTSDCHFKSRNV